MADLNLDHPERPERNPELRRYAVIDRWNGAIVGSHEDEDRAERDVITAGNPHLVILDLEEPPGRTEVAPARQQAPAHPRAF